MTRGGSMLTLAFIVGLATAVGTAVRAQDAAGAGSRMAASGHREATLGGTPEEPALRVEIWLDSERITVADRVTLSVRVESRPGVQYAWTPPTGMFGDFQVAQQSEDLEETRAGVVVKIFRFVLEPRNADGAKEVPALDFRLTGSKGPEVGMKMRTPAMAVQVDSVLDEASRESPQFSAPKGVLTIENVEDRRLSGRAAVAIGAGSAVGMGAAWAAMVYLRRRGAETPSPTEAARTSFRRIRTSLEQLREKPFVASATDDGGEQIRRLGSSIGATTRAYLEDHLGVKARAAVVHELGERLKAAPALSHEMAARLGVMLSRLEASTFAPERPSAGEMLEALGIAEAMLAETATYIQPGERKGVERD